MLSIKMKESFVLIKCQPGYEANVIKELRKIEQVREIRRVVGEYDLLVKLEMPDESEAYQAANKKILGVDKVRSIEGLASIASDI